MTTMSGVDAPVLDGQPAAGAAVAGQHLVGDEQHVVAVADLADPLVVLRGPGPRAVTVEPMTGSAMNAAMLSGPSIRIVRSRSSAQATPHARVGVPQRAAVAVRRHDVRGRAAAAAGTAPARPGGRTATAWPACCRESSATGR